MEEFNDLVGQICNPSTTSEGRSYAERRLFALISNENAWKPYSAFLFQANDAAVFFICIGLERIVWKCWDTFSFDDKVLFNQTITQALVARKDMSPYALSKLEQVLATICACSCSLEPAYGLMVDASQPGARTGLSVMRTVLDSVLSENPKLVSLQKQALVTSTLSIVGPLTNLACSVCTVALQNANSESKGLMLTALDLLKIIISKLPIGDHITSDVIQLLFVVAEQGAETDERFDDCAISAMEVLTEVMSKRFLPSNNSSSNSSTDTAINNNSHNSFSTGSSSSGAGAGGSGGGQGAFGGSAHNNVDMLLDLVGKSISLLKRFRMQGQIEGKAVVLSLLEFISVFAEGHLERCIGMSRADIGSPGLRSGLGLSGQMTANMPATDLSALNTNIQLFFEELVALTTSTNEPDLLGRVVSTWNRVLSLQLVKEVMLNQSAICLNMVSHLLSSCLVQMNTHLQDDLEEIIEETAIDPLVDPHFRSMLSHLLHGGVGDSGGSSSAGTSLGGEGGAAGAGGAVPAAAVSEVVVDSESNNTSIQLCSACSTLFAELVYVEDVRTWLNNTVMTLLGQNMATISSTVHTSKGNCAAAVDLLFLVRILPLLSRDKIQLVSQLVTLTVQLLESGIHSYGKEFLFLVIVCSQISGQITKNLAPTFDPVQPDVMAAMHNLFPLLLRGMNALCGPGVTGTGTGANGAVGLMVDGFGGGGRHVVSTHSASVATAVFLNQAIVAYAKCLEVDTAFRATLFEAVRQLMEHSALMSIELFSLVVCAQDGLEQNSVAAGLVEQCAGVVSVLDASLQSRTFLNVHPTVVSLTRICGAMDCLARNHASSKPLRRQCLVTHFTPLQHFLDKFVTTLFQVILMAITEQQQQQQQQMTQHSGPGSGPNFQVPMGKLLFACQLIVSLSCSLLQSLGRKTFGKVTGDVLNVCVSFAENLQSMAASPGGAAALSRGSSAGASTGSDQAAHREAEQDIVDPKKLLFAGRGLALSKQLLTLAQVLAKSTPGASTSAGVYTDLTLRLLTVLSSGMGDEKVCAELLQPTLKTGVVAIGCYWQKGGRPIVLNPSAAFSGAGAGASIAGGIGFGGGVQVSGDVGNATTSSAQNGVNVQPIAVLLTQLCIGSLGPTVPPQDTITALDGLLSLGEQHQLFAVPWFQTSCWRSLLTPCLKAVVLRIHSMHRDTIEIVLLALAADGLKSYLMSCGLESTNSSPLLQSKTQEFWLNVGREVIAIVTEYGCSDKAERLVMSAIEAVNVSGGGLDMRIFLDSVVTPLCAEISRISTK